jgi:hypothetical protein
MIRWLLSLWRDWSWERQRAIDLDVLWPIVKEQAGGDLARAHEAFFVHAFNDPCWVVYYGDNLWDEVTKLK